MQFAFERVFDPDDYLYFYSLRLTPERNDQDAERVWRLLDLAPGMTVLDLACGHGRIANRLAERDAW
jgi:cyclopropane fatty-acyl-phospholipid synthase-like methyltransferase